MLELNTLVKFEGKSVVYEGILTDKGRVSVMPHELSYLKALGVQIFDDKMVISQAQSANINAVVTKPFIDFHQLFKTNNYPHGAYYDRVRTRMLYDYGIKNNYDTTHPVIAVIVPFGATGWSVEKHNEFSILVISARLEVHLYEVFEEFYKNKMYIGTTVPVNDTVEQVEVTTLRCSDCLKATTFNKDSQVATLCSCGGKLVSEKIFNLLRG